MWKKDAFFKKSDMYQYVTAQQMAQVEAMNPRAALIAYETAVGFIQSEIGYIYDLNAMFNYTRYPEDADDPDRERDATLYWIMLTITCRNFLGATLAVSTPLQQQYEEAIAKINILKAGFSSMYNAPKAKEPNATIEVINNSKKFLG